MIKKIRASGANVLLIQKSILRDAVTDLSLHYLVPPPPSGPQHAAAARMHPPCLLAILTAGRKFASTKALSCYCTQMLQMDGTALEGRNAGSTALHCACRQQACTFVSPDGQVPCLPICVPCPGT